MKRIPFHISVGLLSACVLVLVFWEFRASVNEARANYRNESHNLALGDEAKLVQKLSWMQAALRLVSRDQVVETFVAAGGPLPPMARPRVQPAFELLAENSESVSIVVLSFFAPDDGLLLRVDVADPEKSRGTLGPEEELALAYLSERFQHGADGFLASPPLAERQTFLYAWPITHRGRTVGLTALEIRFDELRSGMSPLVQQISEPSSGLIIDFRDTAVGPTENYSETLRVADDWRVRFSRPDTDFLRRPDVAKARQAALLHTAIVFMGLLAAISLAQRRAARIASQAKSEFLSNISHEVRAPLNGVIGMTDLVLKTTVTPLQREYLKTVSSSAECVLNLVNDLLDLSKVEAGALQLDPVDVSLVQLFETTVRWFQERAQDKGVQLELKLDDDLPKLVKVDPLRLRQVVTNLVSNAVKFTHEGKVAIVVSVATDDLVRVKVKDTGIGISPEQLERVFEPFQQAGGHISRSYGGTGLGLSICKELVDLLGGELKVESELKKGSTFVFTFRAPEVEPTEELAVESLSVLVVDDGPINRKLVCSIVEEWGHRVRTCRDGAQALEVLSEDKFDLVLLDLQMPGVDGLEVARTMRARGDRTPIVALTGNALSEDRKRCREAGMDAHVSKPIDERRLERVIRQVLPTRNRDPKGLDSRGVFDARRSLRRVGGDPRILERVIRLFCERYEKHLCELRTTREDPTMFAQAVQSLKNSVSPFAGDRLSAAIALAESCEVECGLEKELESLRDALREFLSERDL